MQEYHGITSEWFDFNPKFFLKLSVMWRAVFWYELVNICSKRNVENVVYLGLWKNQAVSVLC